MTPQPLGTSTEHREVRDRRAGKYRSLRRMPGGMRWRKGLRNRRGGAYLACKLRATHPEAAHVGGDQRMTGERCGVRLVEVWRSKNVKVWRIKTVMTSRRVLIGSRDTSAIFSHRTSEEGVECMGIVKTRNVLSACKLKNILLVLTIASISQSMFCTSFLSRYSQLRKERA